VEIIINAYRENVGRMRCVWYNGRSDNITTTTTTTTAKSRGQWEISKWKWK
jgi:hypothetical protein